MLSDARTAITSISRASLAHLWVSAVRYRIYIFFFFQAEDGIRDDLVTGVQTCALPISADRWFRCCRVAECQPPLSTPVEIPTLTRVSCLRTGPGARLWAGYARREAMRISRASRIWAGYPHMMKPGEAATLVYPADKCARPYRWP